MAWFYVSMISAGVPVTGLWCGACGLPSRVRVEVFSTQEGGSDLLATYDACQQCGASGAA